MSDFMELSLDLFEIVASATGTMRAAASYDERDEFISRRNFS
jgi:hypothetical protein